MTEEIGTWKHRFLKEHILPSCLVVSFRRPEATMELYACWGNIPVVSWSDLSIPTVRSSASPLLGKTTIVFPRKFNMALLCMDITMVHP